jgi:hypothetical protein
MNAKQFGTGVRALGASLLVIAAIWAWAALGPAAGDDATQKTPATQDIPPDGLVRNFTLVGQNPLLDSDQGTSSFDPYINPPLGVPRGSNGDITAAGDCVYVGSLIGYQPALIVDISNPAAPTVVGAVPDLVPGVANGLEGIEASDDLLVIDQRNPLGLRFPVPAGLPARGIAIYDIGKNGSTCRQPRLVARFEYQSAIDGAGKDTHTITLWRDPIDPQRVLGVQSFTDEDSVDNTAIQVVDLTGCPQLCNPKVVAKWSARTQYGLDNFGSPRAHTHEAVVSTDGNRIYVSQWLDGFLMLDSSKLIRTLRGQDSCDPNQVTTPYGGADNCIKPLNANYDARAAVLQNGGWSHTPMRVPDRPYVFEGSESLGPSVAKDASGHLIQPVQIASTCPGSLLRMIYIAEDGYVALGAFDAQGQRIPAWGLRGDLYPTPLSHFGTEEQKLENCGANGFKPGTAPLTSSWFSPHNGLVFPNLALVTYYGAGLRAIDISNPYILREVGYFINAPVGTVRWASLGPTGDWGTDPGQVRTVPTVGLPMVLAFSYVLSHNGYVIYSDVNSGLYILKYTGPQNQQIPQTGNCLAGNPGAVAPGYDPCPPYGKWDSPENAWTK